MSYFLVIGIEEGQDTMKENIVLRYQLIIDRVYIENFASVIDCFLVALEVQFSCDDFIARL